MNLVTVLVILLWSAVSWASTTTTPVTAPSISKQLQCEEYAAYRSVRRPIVAVGATTTTTTLVSLSDWSGDFIAWWDCEDATAAERLANDLTECAADTSCDLDNNSGGSGVTKDTTNYKEGAAACSFVDADDEYLDCTDAECGGAGELDVTGSISFGCWGRNTIDDAINVALIKLDTNGGYRLERLHNVDSAKCAIREGAGDLVTAQTADSSWAASTFGHAVCQFDSTADSVQPFIDGVSSGTAGSQGDLAASAATFYLSNVVGTSDWEGQLDECFVIDHALTDESVCRICSCNIDGSNCGCTPGDTASYSDTGRNAADCGSCDLDGPYGQFGCDETAAGIEPPDWSASFVAWWNMEQAAGADAPNSTLASCGSDCDLTQTNGPGRGTGIEGSYAADYDESVGEYHSCDSDTTCEELDITSDITFGCWGESDLDQTNVMIWNRSAGVGGYELYRDAGTDAPGCIGEFATTGTVNEIADTADSMDIDEIAHAVCVFDNTADTLAIYVNGAADGSSAAVGNLGAESIDFEISGSTGAGAYDWDGRLDACFVIDDVLTSLEICRICSCGINGDECICSANDPTVYLDEGRNDSGTPNCGSCTLTDCNATPVVAASDWSASFVAWWDCEEAEGNPRLPNSSTTCYTGGDLATDCNLVEASGTISQTATHVVGSYACEIQTADTERLECAAATCDELLSLTSSVSYGAWIRIPAIDLTLGVVDALDSTNEDGYYLRINTNESISCHIGDGVDTTSESSATSVIAADTWIHATCIHTGGATDEISVYINGAESGAPAETQQDMTASSGEDFLIVANQSGDVLVDELYVFSGALSAAENCRICSCQIDGSLCSCDPDDNTAFKTCTNDADCRWGSITDAVCDTTNGTCSGRNNTGTPNCGGCSPGNCNASAP